METYSVFTVYKETLRFLCGWMFDYFDGMLTRRFKPRSEEFRPDANTTFEKVIASLPRDIPHLNTLIAEFDKVYQPGQVKILFRTIRQSTSTNPPIVQWGLLDIPMFRLHQRLDKLSASVDSTLSKTDYLASHPVDHLKVGSEEWFDALLMDYLYMKKTWEPKVSEAPAHRWLITRVETASAQGMQMASWRTALWGSPRTPDSSNASTVLGAIRAFVGDATVVYRTDQRDGHVIIVRDIFNSRVLVQQIAKAAGLSFDVAREQLKQKDPVLRVSANYLTDTVPKLSNLIDKNLTLCLVEGSLSE